ncbi:class I SAM-dependent methyltransferase, partial [candidate division KSB1 bacterium]|nr:class I SAM-dependent methyltransferase [candidate division KSB1 bacterium]
IELLGERVNNADQIGMALTLSELNPSIGILDTADNCPTHLKTPLTQLRPPRALHYHKKLTEEEFLTLTKIEEIDKKIRFANQRIRAWQTENDLLFNPKITKEIKQNQGEKPKKKIYIHIGPHKTATTTIQNGLIINRQKLEEKDYYIPYRWSSFKSYLPLQNIAFQLDGDVRYKPDMGGIDDLLMEINETNCSNIILTSEQFSELKNSSVKTLRDLLAPFGEMVIILYLRRQDQWLNSYYAQLVKRGFYSDDFDSFCKQTRIKITTLKEGGQKTLVDRVIEPDFSRLLLPWEKFFGQPNIRVRVLEEKQLQGNVFQDFLETIGIAQIGDLDTPDDTNVSLGPKTLAVIKHLASDFELSSMPSHKSFMYRITEYIRHYSFFKQWNEERFNAIDSDRYKQITAQYSESNKALANKYFGREQLFLEPFVERPISPMDISDFDPTELIEMCGYILKRVKEDNGIPDLIWPNRPTKRDISPNAKNAPLEGLNELTQQSESTKKIFIHIGLHKTATTTIQNALIENRSLLEENGFYVPFKWNTSGQFSIFLYNIASELTRDPDNFIPEHGTMDTLLHEISNSAQSNIILSSENFSFLESAGIRELHQTLSQLGELFIVVYLRPQDSWLNAWYTQIVKMGLYEGDFASFYEQLRKNQPVFYQDRSPQIRARDIQPDYAAFLEPWEDVFGIKNIFVRVLNDNQDQDHVLMDFFDVVGLKHSPVVTPDQKNISPSHKTIEIIRYLASILGRGKLPMNKSFMTKISIYVREYAQEHEWNIRKYNAVNKEFHQNVLERYDASNRRVAKKYFNRDHLFLPTYVEKPITDFNLSDLHSSEILALISYLLMRIKNDKTMATVIESDQKENSMAEKTQRTTTVGSRDIKSHKILKPLSFLFDSSLEIGFGDLEIIKRFPLKNYVGVDFDERSVQMAREIMPYNTFRLLSQQKEREETFDLVLLLDDLPRQQSIENYRSLIDFALASTGELCLIAGYENPPKDASDGLFFHEPLSKTLGAHPQIARIEKLEGFPGLNLFACFKKGSKLAHNTSQLISISQYIQNHTQTDYPDEFVEIYKASVDNLKFFTSHYPRIFEYPWMMAQVGKDIAGKRFLDVGAGLNGLPFWLSAQKAIVDTVDNHSHIRYLQQSEKWNEWGFLDYNRLDPTIHSFNQNILDFAPGQPYDVIYSISVIEHMPAAVRRQMLARMTRYLKKGGKLALTFDLVPGTNDLWNLAQGKEVDTDTEHGTLGGFIAELEQAGITTRSLEVLREIANSHTDIARLIAEKTGEPRTSVPPVKKRDSANEQPRQEEN